MLKGLFRLGPWADGADAYDAGNLVSHGNLAADDACHRRPYDYGPVKRLAQAFEKGDAVYGDLVQVVGLAMVRRLSEAYKRVLSTVSGRAHPRGSAVRVLYALLS